MTIEPQNHGKVGRFLAKMTQLEVKHRAEIDVKITQLEVKHRDEVSARMTQLENKHRDEIKDLRQQMNLREKECDMKTEEVFSRIADLEKLNFPMEEGEDYKYDDKGPKQSAGASTEENNPGKTDTSSRILGFSGLNVAFSAYMDHDTDLGQGQLLVFNHLLLNEGNAYNRNTGIFTVPTAGVYSISFFIDNIDEDDLDVEEEVTSEDGDGEDADEVDDDNDDGEVYDEDNDLDNLEEDEGEEVSNLKLLQRQSDVLADEECNEGAEEEEKLENTEEDTSFNQIEDDIARGTKRKHDDEVEE